MNPIKGTPKTLLEAIQNGITQFHDPKAYPNSVEGLEHCIKLHVRDFLAQHFSKPMLETSKEESARFKALFDRIIAVRADVCDHTHKDKHNWCMDCGADCSKEMLSELMDRGKDIRKYGA